MRRWRRGIVACTLSFTATGAAGYARMQTPSGTPQREADSPRAIRVAIIEDMLEVREGLMTLINGTAGFRCSSGFRTMEEALSDLDITATDVILIDLGLPGMSGTQ